MLELVGLYSDADTMYAVMLDGQPRTIDTLLGITSRARPKLRTSLRAHWHVRGPRR